jgi:hypothetical protein
LLLLLKTFFDIIVLRKGPDSVPSSWLIFTASLVMMVLSSYAAIVLIGVEEGRSYLLTFISYALVLFFYAAVVYLSGYSRRMLQTLSSIIACGSIITVLFVASFIVFAPLLGKQFAAFVATLIVFWSVPVEGHIIARAIEQHWFVGIVIAVSAFVLQYGLQAAFSVAH